MYFPGFETRNKTALLNNQNIANKYGFSVAGRPEHTVSPHHGKFHAEILAAKPPFQQHTYSKFMMMTCRLVAAHTTLHREGFWKVIRAVKTGDLYVRVPPILFFQCCLHRHSAWVGAGGGGLWWCYATIVLWVRIPVLAPRRKKGCSTI